MIDQPNETIAGVGLAPGRHSRADQKARTRQSILVAAGRAFASRGFDGASLREIADAAGVGQPLVAYHFGSKEGVWRAAVERLFRGVVDAVDDALARAEGAEGEARIRVVLRSFIGAVAEDPAWLQILLREAAEPGPRLDWLVEHHSRGTYEAGVGFLAEARALGVLPPLPTDHLLYVLVGALTFVVAIAPEVERVAGHDVRSDDFLDRHVDTFLTLLTAGQAR